MPCALKCFGASGSRRRRETNRAIPADSRVWTFSAGAPGAASSGSDANDDVRPRKGQLLAGLFPSAPHEVLELRGEGPARGARLLVGSLEDRARRRPSNDRYEPSGESAISIGPDPPPGRVAVPFTVHANAPPVASRYARARGPRRRYARSKSEVGSGRAEKTRVAFVSVAPASRIAERADSTAPTGRGGTVRHSGRTRNAAVTPAARRRPPPRSETRGRRTLKTASRRA